MRASTGAALAALTVFLSGCSGLLGPEPTASPPGVPAALSAPVAVVGTTGRPVRVGSLVAMVVGASAWPAAEQTLGPDLRGVAVRIRLSATDSPLELAASQFQLVSEETGLRYAAGARPGSGDLQLPIRLAAGTSIEGLLSFAPPRGGSFSLRIVVDRDLSARIPVGAIRSSSSSVAATAGAEAPTAMAVPCLKVGGGRWDPRGDDDRPPALDVEAVKVSNTCADARMIGGWTVHDEGRENAFVFPDGFTIPAGGEILIVSGTGTDDATTLHVGRTSGEIWGNAWPERAYLRNAAGELISDWSRYRKPG